MEENIFYVYVYLDPRKPGHYVYGEYTFDYEPFYVGKGSNDRMYDHLKISQQNRNGNRSFINKIKKIQRITGNDPIIIKYCENMLEDISFDLEVNMVATIGRKDLKKGPVCNLTDAGEGMSGYIFSDERKMEHSKRMHLSNLKDNPAKRDDVKEKLRKKALEQFSTPESRIKHSKILTGRKKSEAAKLNMRKYGEDKREEIRELRKKGLTLTNIVKISGVSIKTVRNCCVSLKRGCEK